MPPIFLVLPSFLAKLLSLRQVQPQAPGPFFTNDIAGMFKVVIAIGGPLFIFSTIVVKWGQSIFSKRLDKLETDLNNQGEVVNGAKLENKSTETKHGELKERFDRKEAMFDALSKDVSQVEGLTRSMEKQQQDLQSDLMNMMLAMLKDRDIKIEEMGKDIARLQERENTRSIVREMLNARET